MSVIVILRQLSLPFESLVGLFRQPYFSCRRNCCNALLARPIAIFWVE